jgi:hypothetical protein
MKNFSEDSKIYGVIRLVRRGLVGLGHFTRMTSRDESTRPETKISVSIYWPMVLKRLITRTTVDIEYKS